jgi:hypothetical protein
MAYFFKPPHDFIIFLGRLRVPRWMVVNEMRARRSEDERGTYRRLAMD